ncbi:MAG: CRISPR-associated protein Cas2 [Alteromonadaceae bacterium]|nr:CRISPR-associated protein Cas2 [Alteromonadaceae bacterium]
MSSYVVCYDLSNPKKDYSDLFKRIKSYIAYYHCLDTTWIIKTEFSEKQIKENLRQALTQQDRLFVARIHCNEDPKDKGSIELF